MNFFVCFFSKDENRRLTDEIEFLRRQLQIDKEKMHLLEETLENLKNQGLINAGKRFPENFHR